MNGLELGRLGQAVIEAARPLANISCESARFMGEIRDAGGFRRYRFADCGRCEPCRLRRAVRQYDAECRRIRRRAHP